MEIVWNLAAVMDERGLNYLKLGELTGLHPVTISKLRHQPPDRIHIDTLQRLCTALGCLPGDLLLGKVQS